VVVGVESQLTIGQAIPAARMFSAARVMAACS